MEIILSSNCKSLTGTLGSGFGYHIQSRTDLDGTIRYWGVRKSRGAIPADGHLRFIFACAELAKAKLHIADIRVSGWEIFLALEEAGFNTDNFNDSVSTLYNAQYILTLKERINL